MAARRPAKGPVVKATEAELRDLGAKPATSALAASALALAREIDSVGSKAAEKAACARAMRETLDRLRELLPPKKKADAVDILASRRAKRRARQPAS